MYNQKIAIPVGADLTADLYKALTIAGVVAASGSTAVGLCYQRAKSTENFVEVAYSGRAKFQSGGAVTAGNKLTVAASGFITAATSGDIVVGTALFTCASGSIQEGIFDFANAAKGY